EQETVMGLLSKDCILPCPFPPGQDEVIYWKKGSKTVHSYYYQRDQLGMQDLDYRHRTHLFHENIPGGNASLKLMNLSLADEGSYNCYVGTQQGKTEVEVTLHVRVSSHYALKYQKTDSERMLKCYAFHTYPAPAISWLQGNTSIQETRREESRDGVLYSLRTFKVFKKNNCQVLQFSVSDQLSSIAGRSIAIPCECSNSTEDTEGFSVVWTLNRNAEISVLVSFNGTSHSYQPRAQINQNDFSLMLHDLTASDSGEYLCNISTPHYMKLTVRTLEV
ncbi:HHLA2 protein, partial [Alcedo cyanopectus]|nr:HHLA2 protein [Ceyx cyanopectus]